MAIIYQPPTPITGTTGLFPNFKYMIVGDNLATITTAGYLTQSACQPYTLNAQDIIPTLYSYNPVTKSGVYGLFEVLISSTNGITLTEHQSQSGVNATLPTIINHIAVYSDVTGDITEDAATAINAGNIQAGVSTGTAGSLISMPGTSNKGSLQITGANNTGNTVTTITNTAMGQATTFTVPDPAGATANFLVAPSALVNNNIVSSSGTAGTVIDSGIAVSNIQLKSYVKAGLASVLGASTTFPVGGVQPTSSYKANVISSTNPGVYVISCGYSGVNTVALTLSADPGASCAISYMIFVAPQ